MTRAWTKRDDWPMPSRCPECHRTDYCGRDPENLTVEECETWERYAESVGAIRPKDDP